MRGTRSTGDASMHTLNAPGAVGNGVDAEAPARRLPAAGGLTSRRVAEEASAWLPPTHGDR